MLHHVHNGLMRLRTGAWVAAKLLPTMRKSSTPSLFPLLLFLNIHPYLSFKPALMEKDPCICKWQSWKPITGIQWSTVERPSPGLDYWPLGLISAPSPCNYPPQSVSPSHTHTHRYTNTCTQTVRHLLHNMIPPLSPHPASVYLFHIFTLCRIFL